MTTHVLIVDARTLKVHLEYLFGGTGAGEHDIDFNNLAVSGLHHTTERNLAGMIADAMRARVGDQVIFYLQADQSRGISDGKFFGVFRVASLAYIDRNDGQQFLRTELGKSLILRLRLEPLEVFADGITEWEALDQITADIDRPYKMQWSLIYRKLKAMRGNSMITTYEADRLINLIRTKNSNSPLDIGGRHLSFDTGSQKIILNNTGAPAYNGRTDAINILPRLLAKYASGLAFEGHLQAYIVGALRTGQSATLDNLFPGTIVWLGNEVSCGVGMQKIDVLVCTETDADQAGRIIFPVELKDECATAGVTRQIGRYVKWLMQYYVPNQIATIQPVLLAKEVTARNSADYTDLVAALIAFNALYAGTCLPIKYVEFVINNGAIAFNTVNY